VRLPSLLCGRNITVREERQEGTRSLREEREEGAGSLGEGKEEGAGSLWEGREEGAASGISKVARGRRDEKFSDFA